MAKRKYQEKDIQKWAYEYEKCYSFKKVGEIFDIDQNIIRKILNRDQSKTNIKTLRGLFKDGNKRCSINDGCGKIKKFSEFDYGFGNRSKILNHICKECFPKYYKKYRKDNKDKKNINDKKLKENNINYRISCNLRTRLSGAVKNNQKNGSAVKDLGCSIEKLKQYLEKQFYPNKETGEQMTWENYGLYGWHIDHIMPLSGFDLTNRKQFLKACHYTNLQPLWAKENLKKYNNQIKEK